MRKAYKYIFYGILMGILFSFIILCLMVIIFNQGKENPVEIKEEINYKDLSCENMSLIDTAFCLNTYVKKIFIYNVTNDSIHISLEELQERGGDCMDWTRFYNESMNSYGFNNSQIVRMHVKKGEDHVFLMVNDKIGYCNMDMKDVRCYKFDDFTAKNLNSSVI